jgi:hypothetical protein
LKSSLEATSTIEGACDEAGLVASARTAAGTLLNAWHAYYPSARARLVNARNAGIGLTVVGAILVVVGGVAGGVMSSQDCGRVVDDECSNLGSQIGGRAVLASVVPLGGLLVVAGAPVWGVYQHRLDRFDAAASKAQLVGIGPLLDPRTGTKGLVATFSF